MIRIVRNASGQKVRLFIPDVDATRRVGSWMKLHCGDTVIDEADPRHIGRVEAIINGTVTVRWHGTGWKSQVPMERVTKWTPTQS